MASQSTAASSILLAICKAPKPHPYPKNLWNGIYRGRPLTSHPHLSQRLTSSDSHQLHSVPIPSMASRESNHPGPILPKKGSSPSAVNGYSTCENIPSQTSPLTASAHAHDAETSRTQESSPHPPSPQPLDEVALAKHTGCHLPIAAEGVEGKARVDAVQKDAQEPEFELPRDCSDVDKIDIERWIDAQGALYGRLVGNPKGGKED
ncbi:hypothetical protein BU26DRAFT_605978 [Trematosphaeria pertusa]|uniref:Uncharacterized protein n=1 Tax=Trematosphaeria pertusa TaxID=390896 RepID=A0A6A6IEN2_9PLEO|nr:uncharacterized protein BU26DRAFT_605978 [Trematosphaeria pertusa]KAF2248528.1 hypothetical protein BU26DRAFT_605978 [Trematosphaeria pertusa]